MKVIPLRQEFLDSDERLLQLRGKVVKRVERRGLLYGFVINCVLWGLIVAGIYWVRELLR